MGQKVHPVGFRLGVIRDWDSRWFFPTNYADYLHEDLNIRRSIKKRFQHAGIAKIEIERATTRIKVIIHTARPGIIIGKKGSEIEGLRKDLEALSKKNVIINIEEVKRPDLSAQLVAENVSGQLMRRIGFRRAMKKTMQACMKSGALGVKIHCGGRLGGSEMARQEWVRDGRVPLHTLRADIDYGFAEAATKFGVIGVKVWIFRGEVFDKKKKAA
ncbi:MAG: small subunit ribosomal protein [Candidatus Sumerlaeota bacterium]|nr:small subunit ribosomal protein [Candidatus Sumerlaeota bacterium]